MQIELTKRADGAATLRCLRGDHSITWRASPQPLHDLTRYAVESFLQLREGYWDRIANGAKLDQTAAQSGLSGNERLSLQLTQKFDVELAGVIAWHAAELGVPAVDEAAVEGIRALRDRLFRQWFERLPGEVLLLEWPAGKEA